MKRLIPALTPLLAGSAPGPVGLGAISILGANALALFAAAFFALARFAPAPVEATA